MFDLLQNILKPINQVSITVSDSLGPCKTVARLPHPDCLNSRLIHLQTVVPGIPCLSHRIGTINFLQPTAHS